MAFAECGKTREHFWALTGLTLLYDTASLTKSLEISMAFNNFSDAFFDCAHHVDVLLANFARERGTIDKPVPLHLAEVLLNCIAR